MSDMTTRTVLSPREVCERIGIGMTTLRRYMDQGTIKANKVGGRVFVPVAELEQFEGKREAQAPAP